MKAVVVYVKGHPVSEEHKDRVVESLERYNWDYVLMEGVTPDTLDDWPSYDDLEGGRLSSFMKSEPHKYPIKKSCVTNHIRFAEMVIESNEPMVLLEHDQLVISPPVDFEFEDYCQLNTEYAFSPPSTLAKEPFTIWLKEWIPTLGVGDLPSDWPLKYYKDSIYKGSNMVPGTGAYALTPNGARKLLDAIKQNGLEQSDFLYNTDVMTIQSVHPSVVKFQPSNPNLSHGL